MHFSVFSRETQPVKYLSIYLSWDWLTDIFKELAHMVVGAGKSEVCMVGHQAGNSCKDEVAFLNKRQSRGRTPSFSGSLSFSLKTFDWLLIDEAHPHCEGGLLYSKSTDRNVSHI